MGLASGGDGGLRCAAEHTVEHVKAGYEGVYRLAGCLVSVRSIYEKVHLRLAPYASEGTPAMNVAIHAGDIDFERRLNERRRNGRRDFGARRDKVEVSGVYPGDACLADAALEELAVYRKIAERMPLRDTVLFHGSALAVDGAAYVFAAPSGTGKSTHARLWRRLLGDRVTMINDDKPLLRLAEGQVWACGTPWDGKHRLSADVSVPLRAVCFLRRGSENSVEPLDAERAYTLAMQQVYMPYDRTALARTLDLLDQLLATVCLYRLTCNLDPDAARVCSEALLV